MNFYSKYINNRKSFYAAVRKAMRKIDKITWDVIENTAYISQGNKKLVSDIKFDYNGTLFLIFNLPAKTTCPFKTEHCSKACYAVKAENNYPDCLPCRKRNFEFTRDTVEFTAFMIRAIQYVCNLKKYQNRPVVVRIHESGDFYSIDYMLSWFTIARYCRDLKNVTFMAYTKSIRFYDSLYRHGVKKPRNMVIRYSIWDDTNTDDIKIAESYGLPIYTAFDSELPCGYYLCECENCAKCSACFSAKNKLIACKIH